MDAEQVIAILGMPDADFAIYGKTAWVRPEKNVLQYSIYSTYRQRKKPPLHVLHVYFDNEGKVLKTVRNGGFLFFPPLR